jgi:hypothetical protein
MNSKLLFLAILVGLSGFAQAQEAKNIILITLDGLRWQEVFSGADSLFLRDAEMVKNPQGLYNEFWETNPVKRREVLLPFFWNAIASTGQLYGNRQLGNKVNTQNTHWFSYPGYNEILSGFADDQRINSNDKINNPNKTFLEYLNQKEGFAGKVLAFGSWDVFPYIINEERSGIPVNAGFEGEHLSDKEELLNRLQTEIIGPWTEVRLDAFTHHFAMEALKNQRPRALYIAYGETDDWAHENHYDRYLWAARQTDDYIKEIWEWVQSDPEYRDNTILIITSDHGRGVRKDTWLGHGSSIPESSETWIALLGAGVSPRGEISEKGQWYNAQIARTIFEMLGFEYPDEKAAKPLKLTSKN